MVAIQNETPLETPRAAPRTATDEGGRMSAGKERRGLFGPEGFSFGALLDIINPLQHIPVVSTIYRAITGDTIENGSRLIGGAIFGGPIGFIASAVSGIIQESTGKDIGDHMLAFAGIEMGGGEAAASGTALAQKVPEAEAAPILALAVDPERLPYNPPVTIDTAASGAASRDAGAPMPSPSLAARAPANALPGSALPVPALPASLPASAPIPVDQLRVQSPAMAQAASAQAQVAPSSGVRPSAGLAGPERQWFPAFPKEGGIVTRGVGAEAVGPQNAALRAGATRGAPAIAGTGSPSQAEIAERANLAYQKYLDLKKRQTRPQELDQSF